jgi:4-methyl-5(b-hydroxyethyl)-thiazole monophosphate biosynthesis
LDFSVIKKRKVCSKTNKKFLSQNQNL